MTITIDATVGGASSNAYDQVSFIDGYAPLTMWATAWAALTDADQKAAFAIRATRAIDQLPYTGYTKFDTQALQFPRYGVVLPRGTRLDPDTIPDVVKRAWAHTACYLASLGSAIDPFTVDDTSKIAKLAVGPVSLDFRQTVGPDGSTFLATVIAPMLRPFGLVGPANSVRLVR